MSTPDPTSAEAVERLRAVDAPPAAPEPAPAPRRWERTAARVAGRGRRAAAGLARRGLKPVLRRAEVEVGSRVQRMVTEALDGDPALAQLREVSERGGLDPQLIRERDATVHSAHVNLELLKGELRHVQTTLDELGMAFAPGTGLAGAGARYAELRESVYALERRLRTAGNAPTTPPDPAAPAAAPIARATPAEGTPAVLSSTLFDYVGFERRFRGDPDAILTTLVDRYADLLQDHQPVVDVGCGRGELLGMLAERGIDVIGVEPDPGMAAEAQARGITVHEELAGDWLRSVPDGSLGAIITTHVLEHLELDDMIELLELAAVKLGPDSVFISETPNPASLIVLGNSYLLDPTHVRPLHPSLLAFLCEKAGFRDVRLRFYSPAEDYHLPMTAVDEDAPAWARELTESVNKGFSTLNEVLFGPQDYAVIARTPPAPES
ncbi:Methyltransferase domain-containing protein [Blastococcus aggregatus]|uniref:Methyltransferase domain-containing protein n=1 Tax=Blastococcus aggregatus TaxID=38502 RepID=A0A285V4E9_9ACTN|nr:class I SAM-dependent methyltransferase [Blastococcus aggregatus]SOC48929.1 Methyltransferase domain-containing protein [Blastococcus aggregatus]